MNRIVLCLSLAVALLAAGCNGQTASDDRGDIWIKHRVPSK